MKVSNKSTAIQLEAYLKQVRMQRQRAATVGAVAGAKRDKVDLSARALEVQQAAKALKEMPDIREEKVNRVRMDIDNGTYRVSGGRVATDMLRETFENNMILHTIDTRA